MAAAVAAHRREVGWALALLEGFKWCEAGLLDGHLGFGGEESAGASFLRRDGRVGTTDKNGLTCIRFSSPRSRRHGLRFPLLAALLILGSAWLFLGVLEDVATGDPLVDVDVIVQRPDF